MSYWLFKSEPETWSWTQQKAKGKAGEEWTGVRNFQARNHMRAMKKGDLGFFYHTGDDKQIVGIVDVYDALTSNRSYRKALSGDEAARLLMNDVLEGKFLKAHVEAFLDTQRVTASA